MFENYPKHRVYPKKLIEIDFSNDFFWVPPSTSIYQQVVGDLTILENTPEPFASSLAHKIAHQDQMPEDSIAILPGLQAAVYHLIQLLRNSTCQVISPSPPYLVEVTKYFGVRMDFSESPQRYGSFRGYKFAWIANPNLVDGRILFIDELEEIIREHPETIFVLDETFIDFCEYTSSATHLVKQHDNLIIIKSLSERGGLTSLNVSYIYAHKRIITALKKGTPAFMLNTLTTEAGKLLHEHIIKNTLNLEKILTTSKRFAQQLNELKNFEVYKTYCHYFLVNAHQHTAQQIKEYLWDKGKICINTLDGYHGVQQSHFRICTLHQEMNQSLINLLNNIDTETLYT